MNEHPRIWSLQEAKAKFSEVVRLAQTQGPQVVTVHGKAMVKISAVDELAERTGQALIDAIQACPHRLDYAIVAPGEPMLIGDPVEL